MFAFLPGRCSLASWHDSSMMSRRPEWVVRHSLALMVACYVWGLPVLRSALVDGCEVVPMVRAATLFAPRSTRHVSRWGRGGTLTLSLLGSLFRPPTVPITNVPLRRSEGCVLPCTVYATLGMERVPCDLLTHYTAWDSLHGKQSIPRSRWRRKPCTNVPIPLSHRSTSPTTHNGPEYLLHARTLGRTPKPTCVGGVQGRRVSTTRHSIYRTSSFILLCSCTSLFNSNF